jgi:hypothetical protein
MTINAALGSVSYDDERARAHGHGPMILSGVVDANQGALPVGLLLSRNATDELIPYEAVEDEAVGTGDGTNKAFADTLAKASIEPGTVSVTDGVETFTDDGYGRLTGSAGGTGTINYTTGALSVTFNAAPANAAAVTADYVRELVGVLDETIDTTKTTSATYIPHGTVRRDVLKVGAIAKAAPSATELKRLSRKGIWAM